MPDALRSWLPLLVQQWLALSLQLLLIGALFRLAERLRALCPAPLLRAQWRQDLAYCYLGVLPLLVLQPAARQAYRLLATWGPMPWQPWVAALPGPLYFAAWVLLSEAVYYWAHRLAHEVPLLWRFHAVHHSAAHVDWLVNTRAHPLDLLFTRGFVLLGLLLLGWGDAGARSAAPAYYLLLMTLWSYFVHANIRLRLGWLEYLIATPAFHHWHHVTGEAAAVNKNYAAMLPCMDWLFGSFYLPHTRWPARYGVEHPLPDTLVGQLLGPLGWPGGRMDEKKGRSGRPFGEQR